MARTMHEKRPEEDNRYHDTWKLLKKYRDVTWSLEVSVRQVKNQFRIDYDCSIEDFLDSIYMAGADLGGTIIEDHAKCIERSYKMLTLLENAVNLLRTRHKNGEVYYWILYYSFLSPQKLKNVDEIIEVLRPHIRDISSKIIGFGKRDFPYPSFQFKKSSYIFLFISASNNSITYLSFPHCFLSLIPILPHFYFIFCSTLFRSLAITSYNFPSAVILVENWKCFAIECEIPIC